MISTPKAVTTDGAWHGAVPVGWSLKQLKWAVAFQRGHDLPTEDRQEGPVPVVTGAGITGWHNVAQAKGPGIVTGRYGTIGEFHLVEQDYWPLNTSLYSIDLHGNHAGFLRYMLEPLAPLFHLNAAKSAVPGIDRSDIHTIPVAVPPLATQRAIAAYLDRETAQLDGLVAAKERVLRLLEEKRRALITRAVTRGLAPRAPLRDSGIPWLGEIPAHWPTKRLRWLIRTIEQGWSPEAENREPNEDEWAVLKLNAVAHGQFNPSAAKALPVGLEARPDLEVHPGDFLITRANTPALVGDVCFITEVRPLLMLCDLIYRLRLFDHRLDRQYLSHFFTSPKRREQIESDARGTSNSMVKISQEHIKNWWLPLPPIDEQRAIVAYIATETAKLDALRSATECTIALLKERRAALIAAAVTGKINVQGGIT
jgi:type I restriction enzyme, S subunit